MVIQSGCGVISGCHLLPCLESHLRGNFYTITRVSEIISHNKAAWKTQVIDAIFLPHEAELIKSIPLSSRLPEDKLVWAATPNGSFTV